MNNIIRSEHAARWRWVNDIVNGKNSTQVTYFDNENYTNIYWLSKKLSNIRFFIQDRMY